MAIQLKTVSEISAKQEFGTGSNPVQMNGRERDIVDLTECKACQGTGKGKEAADSKKCENFRYIAAAVILCTLFLFALFLNFYLLPFAGVVAGFYR